MEKRERLENSAEKIARLHEEYRKTYGLSRALLIRGKKLEKIGGRYQIIEDSGATIVARVHKVTE